MDGGALREEPLEFHVETCTNGVAYVMLQEVFVSSIEQVLRSDRLRL